MTRAISHLFAIDLFTIVASLSGLVACATDDAGPSSSASGGTSSLPGAGGGLGAGGQSGADTVPSSGAAGATTASGGVGGTPGASGGAGASTGGVGSGTAGGAGGAPGSTGGASASGGSGADAGLVVPPMDGATVPPAQGFLHTHGSDIVDSDGQVVRLTGLSWFGLETSNYAPHGLWSRSLGSMLDQIESLGYNSIRVPFSSQLFDAGSTPNGVDANANPDLVGKTGPEILDAVIKGAGARGLKIILDRHRPDSGAQSELWYTDRYSEARWIDDWKALAAKYQDDPTVVAFDLHNEPHGAATWGDGNTATDWRAAAERAGNAVLDVNPNLLIVVEGVEKYEGTGAWWGGNLRGAGTHPVNLKVKDRLVYSPHEYPASVFNQPWFSDPTYPANLPGLWDATFGYLAKSGVAPVWIGEFGTRLQTDSDKQWLTALASYVKDRSLSFAYWCWNPNSGDTGGILQDDWQTVNQDKQSVLTPLLAPKIP